MSVVSMQKLWKNDFHNYIWYSLHANGWKYVMHDPNFNEGKAEDLYQLTILGEYETTVTAHIVTDIDGFRHFAHLGVSWLEGEYEYQEQPLSFEALDDMRYALENAEDNLLALGIPFDDKYDFHGKNKANKKRRNDAIRRKLNIAEQEEKIRAEIKKQREEKITKGDHL